MANFNYELTSTILEKCKDLSLSDQLTLKDGRFLADKSYGFDTMFFVARYIQRFRFGNKYRRNNIERENEYVRDLFCLRDAAQVKNYFTEALALLRFVKAVKKINNDLYEIIDNEIMDIYSSSLENAYIFQYLLCYSVFKSHGLWNYYKDFCDANTLSKKQIVYNNYVQAYDKKDARVKDPSKLWGIFTPKYPMVILNYANRQNMVARTGNVSDDIVSRTDIALNVQGNRANTDLPKKNAYLSDLSESYIIETLRPFLVTNLAKYDKIEYTDEFSIDVADTKLDMFDARDQVVRVPKSQSSKYKYVGGVKTRTVQGEFRHGLLNDTPHVCPVCGFSYEDFLIASHIKPYAKCDDTYDAMNPNNGLLMCPVCDKLFESANYMTIDPNTGKVIYLNELENEKDFQYLHNKAINNEYIDCERKHYLRWHYNYYLQKHGQQSFPKPVSYISNEKKSCTMAAEDNS